MTPTTEILQYLPLMQTFFFICLFFIVYKKINSARFVLTYMTICFFGFATEILSNFMYYPLSVWSYYVTIPFLLATMPILYIYVSSLTSLNLVFRKRSLLHFTPAIIILIINIISFNAIPKEIRIKLVELNLSLEDLTNEVRFYIKLYGISQYVIYNAQVLFYSLLLIFKVFIHRKKIENYFSNTELYKLNWLNTLVIIIAIFSLADIYIYFTDLKILNPWIYSLIIFVYISIIGFGAVWQKEIYTITDNLLSSKRVNNLNPKLKETTEESSLSILAGQIAELIEQEKLFLNPNLTIEIFAVKLNTHRNIISRCINEYYKMNFHHFINEYRIKHATELLQDPKSSNITIEGIAINSGFNSKSVFNPAFKAKMKLTPSQYKKRYL